MKAGSLEIITLDEPYVTDFAAARNRLLKNAKAEWVFFVDSDEVMSRELYNEALKQIQKSEFSGFYVKRKNLFLGKYAGTDRTLRLGRKDAGKWVRPVHETWEVKGKIGELKNPLIHNTAKNLHGFIEKIDKYSTLHAKENQREGKKSIILKIIFFPVFKFLQSLLMGRGFVMSMLQSFHSFLSWSKLWLLQRDLT